MEIQSDNRNENYIFGIRPVIEAITAGKEIDKILIQNGLGSDTMWELRALIKEFDIPFQYVPIEKLNRITRKNHQGIICFVSPVSFQKVEDILPQIYENGEVPLILILDRVSDVRNFGAITRTAECAGVHAILTPIKGSAQINPDAIKTSAGALYKIPVCRYASLKNIIPFLKESGLQIISCTERTGNMYYNIDFTMPTAIILGSEEDGISESLLGLSDKKVKIPLNGEIGSLNVSVASGVVLYEIIRQRSI